MTLNNLLKAQALFWERSDWWRRPARQLKRRLAKEKTPRKVSAARIAHPAIRVHRGKGVAKSTVDAFLTGQTEASISDTEGEFLWIVDEDPGGLPANHLELLLLRAASERRAWSRLPETEESLAGPSSSQQSLFKLWRLRVEDLPEPEEIEDTEITSAADLLTDLLPIPGPRTVLFLLPNLAVGGAERQLFDLIESLRDSARILVVTTDPHADERGSTIGKCRKLIDQVYPLGDFLPREARFDALCHLLRRWQVQSLVSWNGSVLFYDHAARLRELFPDLQIAAQLYDARGGWIARLGPRTRAAIDVHLVVNRHTGKVLREELDVEPEKIRLIHHGVSLPPQEDASERATRRAALRERLGLPPGATVVGTFIRMHAQKRPHDVLALARRLPELHFLLVGGGPLSAEIDHELTRRPIANLTRLPLQEDARKFYDAVDLCLLTSAYEGLPFFLLDALTQGIPCVAPAVGEIPLLLRDGGGVAVETVGDLDAFAAGLQALRDPKRRETEGARGRETIEKSFHIERFRRETEDAVFSGEGTS